MRVFYARELDAYPPAHRRMVTAPIVVSVTHGWTTWMVVAIVFEALYIPAIFAFRGPWLRPAAQPAEVTSPA